MSKGTVRRNRSSVLRIGCLVVCLIIVLSIAYCSWALYVPVTADEIIIRIMPGDNAAIIAGKLHELGIIRNQLLFRLMVKLSRSDRNLKAGTYVFGGRINLIGAIYRLRSGKSTRVQVTLPEGLSLYRTLQRIERSRIHEYDPLYLAATDTALVRRLTGFEKSSLEGFLYPETYHFDISTSPDSTLALMTNLFFRKLRETGIEIGDRDEFYRILILASIIEKEAVQEDEMPLIASVYWNRLRRGMRLESCPTVDYILERRGIRKARLSREDTNISSPYNTYINAGLPPTPICNPSINAIKAALHPQKSSFYFFFADNKGRNVFSASYEEHVRKQRQYR
ncbi:MAG: endolytic transglycosylase MltG [Candidatus Cloacimonetes bacterium]|nr:endolytic transglycosylase MltG [Candidatus Cloacimonadota bacterium]